MSRDKSTTSFLGLIAGGNLIHIFFECRRHVGARDLRCELAERVAYGNAELAWLDRIVLHVFHRVKALDNRMARGLVPKPKRSIS